MRHVLKSTPVGPLGSATVSVGCKVPEGATSEGWGGKGFADERFRLQVLRSRMLQVMVFSNERFEHFKKKKRTRRIWWRQDQDRETNGLHY